MSDLSHNSAAPWAVEFGTTAVRMVRLSDEPGRRRIVAAHTEPVNGPEDWAAAVRRLPDMPGDRPVGACISGELTLYRRLTLPAAEGEVLRRMVRAQAQVLLPGLEMLAWDWMPLDAGPGAAATDDDADGAADAAQQAVLIAAVGRQVLDRVIGAMAPLGEPVCVLPSAVAVANAVARAADLPAEPCLIVEVNERHTGLLVMAGGRPHGCAVLEDGVERWIESAARAMDADGGAAGGAGAGAIRVALEEGRPFDGADGGWQAAGAAVLRWARRLAEEDRTLAASTGVRPRHVLLVGVRAGTGAAVCEAVAAALRRQARRLALGDAPAAAGGDDLAVLPAAGAAWAALEPDAPSISFVRREPASQRPRRRAPVRSIAAAVWVLAALLVMYQLDRREADRLGALVEQRRPTAAEVQQLDRSLSLGRYLEQTGVPPLSALAAVTAAAPDSAILDAWHYERNGRLRISGTVGNVADLDRLLNALAASPHFESVRLGPSSFDDRQRHWRFEADMSVRPVARYLADRPRAAPAAGEPDAPAVAERGEATASLDGRSAR